MIEHKVVWITGASSGIGEALAKEYSQRGYFVILSARKVAELERVQSLLANPTLAKVVPLDVGQYHNIDATVQPILKELGRVDILINNAGISQRSDVVNTKLEVYDQIMNVNFMGSVAMTKAVLPMMYERKAGNICVISSVMARITTPSRSGYSASKYALHGFFESLRSESVYNNVHVTMVIPGYVRTNVSKNAVTADGTAHGKMDEVQDNGMAPEKLATEIYNAVAKNKAEIKSGGKELYAIQLARFFPSLYRRIVKNYKPK